MANDKAPPPLAVSKTRTAYYRDTEGWFAIVPDRPGEKIRVSPTRLIVEVDASWNESSIKANFQAIRLLL